MFFLFLPMSSFGRYNTLVPLRKFLTDFNTVCLLCLSWCLLLV